QETISSPTEKEDDSLRSIVLRVLAHPDPRRVGDFAPIFDAKGLGRATLNRFSPEFRAPDGRATGALSIARVTRKSLVIERTAEGVILRNEGALSPVEVQGEPLSTERSYGAHELAEGLVILFGKSLALWLGWLDLIEPSPPIPGLVGEGTAMRRLRQ